MQELGQGITSGQAEVVYDTSGDQAFTVVIPKKIVLGSDKTAEYEITVKGDVAQGSKVKVEPRDDVESENGINFIMTAEKTGISKNADVTQDDVYWDYNEIVANDYNGTAKPGDVDGSELTLGKWQGDLTFLINFEDEYGEEEELSIAPESALKNWKYELDETNKIVTLIHYIGNETNVRVYGSYPINDKIYRTQITNTVNNQSLFSLCTKIETISFDKIDMSNVTDMSYMFTSCIKLTSLNIDNFNTHNVTNMTHMFNGCWALRSLDINNFDTSNVTDMSWMFRDCRAITSLNVSSFNTSNVIDMSNMFANCWKLTLLDISNFNTSNVTNMNYMFGEIGNVSFDFSNFNTSNVTDMSGMFEMCKCTMLDLSNFDTSNVTNMSCMFSNCKSLTSLNIDNFDTQNVTDMSSMFSTSWLLSTLDLSSFDTQNVIDMDYMFYECSSLNTIYVNQNKWITLQAHTNQMFDGCGTDNVTYK